MENKTNAGISVIIPIHELTEQTKQLLSNAVQTIMIQTVLPDELIVVTSKNDLLISFVQSLENKLSIPLTIVENDGETDFASQVNLGVSKAKTKWISILECDDELSKIWFKNVVEYIEAYDNVDTFLPIIIDVDSANNFIGLTNEVVWANTFSDELGYLDNNALLSYQNFSIGGMVMKKSVYEEIGGIKPSFKLTFIYEFLLRMTYNNIKVMVVPKFGYKHLNNREGSLFETYKQTMKPLESTWWISQAKKEFYFKDDRKIKYEE